MENNTITINRIITSNTKVIEVVGDIIVPDIKPDIVSIVNTNAIPYIYKEEVSTGRVRVEGNIETYIVYLAENGENRSIQTTLTFIENIDDNAIKEGAYSREKIYLEDIETKVLNERKISIKANIKIKSDVYEKSNLEISSNFSDIPNLQMQKENVEIKSLVGRNTVKTSVKEDIVADPSYNISEILKVSVDVENIENKISVNKVLAKADCKIKIIFLAEDGRVEALDANLPVMSFIDINKISDTNVCYTDYIIRNMLFRISADKHSINAQVDFEVTCEVYEIKNVEVIQDMYGINNNIEFSKKEAEVLINGNNNEQKISINERVIVEDVLNIYDTVITPKITNINQVGTNYNYECELKITFYYEADSRNGLHVKTVNIPFIVKFGDNSRELEFKVLRKEFTINGENVDCNIEILASQTNNNTKKINIIEDVVINDLGEDDSYKMYVYFVKPGDTVWKISKKFKVPMEEVINLNELENPNNINVGDRLYIMR